MWSRSGLAGLALSGLLATVLIPTGYVVELDRRALEADGRATVTARVRGVNVWGGTTPTRLSGARRALVEGGAGLGLSALYAHDGALVVRAGHAPGRFVITHPEAAPVEVELRLDTRDADEDGLPDAAELLTGEDRAAFVRWFTTLAEAQHRQLDDGWAKVHQDCAGLVRFAYREALKRHDDAWLAKRRYLPRIDHPDVQAIRYPTLPFMGDLPFSVTGRRFDAAKPASEQFTAAPNARTLWQANTRFVSRDLADARAGDLIFYRVPYGRGSRMHTMIVLGARSGASHTEAGRRVVYHTGASGEAEGEVRLVDLETLAAHPDSDWHPTADNPRFLGVHRLALIEHAASAQPNPWAADLFAATGDEP